MKIDTNIQDFYDLCEICKYDLSLIYYILKVFKDRKDKPCQIRKWLEDMNYKKIGKYSEHILDLPKNDFDDLVKLAKIKMGKEEKRNKKVVISSDEDCDCLTITYTVTQSLIKF